jgi:moderate conductance mechanosensitive channel
MTAGTAGTLRTDRDEVIGLRGSGALLAGRHGVDKLLHEHTEVLVARPARILLIILMALFLRLVLHRMIDRLTQATAQGAVPPLLRPLKEHAATAGVFELSPLQSERRRQRAETIGSVLKSAASVAVFIVALLMILGQLDLDLVPLLAGTSIAGVALAFGAQNVIQDFLSGMFMILEDQYGVGDVIDVKEAVGTVEAVGLRTTRLRDETGAVWYMRNGQIVRIANHSQGFAELVVDVPITPSMHLADTARMMLSVATAMAAEEEWREAFTGEPVLEGVQSIGREESLVRLTARVRPAEKWRAGRELRRRIRTELDVRTAPEPS